MKTNYVVGWLSSVLLVELWCPQCRPHVLLQWISSGEKIVKHPIL